MKKLKSLYNILVSLISVGLLFLAPAFSNANELNQQASSETASKAPDMRKGSVFEEYIWTKAADVSQFGHGIFSAQGSFSPPDNIPVNPDYILGPGDELHISIWGKVEADIRTSIDRDGKINIPQIGILFLNGLTFSEARNFLEKELHRYYLASEVKMNMSLGTLRSIRVYVVGKAQRPGSYTMSSLSTVFNALFAAGGPNKVGSMRMIELKRNGKTISALDLYDFLINGDKSGDISLMPEDVVFIPSVGPLAAVTGHVNAPGIYELKGETRLNELFRLAGGLNDIAVKGRVQIERILNNTRESVIEANLGEIDPSQIKVSPGDLVRVFPVVPERKVVRLSGAVEREGEYGIGQGMTIKDLLSLSGGVKYYAYTEEAELTRVRPTQAGPETEKIKIDLKKASEGEPAHNLGLRDNDYLFVRSVPEWSLYRTVKVSGEVRFPGAYTIKKGETISSLLSRAGGFTDKAYLNGAVFMRESVRDLQQKQLNESIGRLEQELLSDTSMSIDSALDPETAKLEQAAASQKTLLISRLRSARAKGRISIRLSDRDKFAGSPSDLVLEDGDSLFIPETPAQVQVMGSVYNQTSFVYRRDSQVSDYIRSAGGMTGSADKDDLYILKVDGTAVSKREASWSLGWDREGGRWIGGGFMSARLDPGDTIVVPEKIDKKAFVRDTKDLTQILYQIAVTAGVLIVAF